MSPISATVVQKFEIEAQTEPIMVPFPLPPIGKLVIPKELSLESVSMQTEYTWLMDEFPRKIRESSLLLIESQETSLTKVSPRKKRETPRKVPVTDTPSVSTNEDEQAESTNIVEDVVMTAESKESMPQTSAPLTSSPNKRESKKKQQENSVESSMTDVAQIAPHEETVTSEVREEPLAPATAASPNTRSSKRKNDEKQEESAITEEPQNVTPKKRAYKKKEKESPQAEGMIPPTAADEATTPLILESAPVGEHVLDNQEVAAPKKRVNKKKQLVDGTEPTESSEIEVTKPKRVNKKKQTEDALADADLDAETQPIGEAETPKKKRVSRKKQQEDVPATPATTVAPDTPVADSLMARKPSSSLLPLYEDSSDEDMVLVHKPASPQLKRTITPVSIKPSIETPKTSKVPEPLVTPVAAVHAPESFSESEAENESSSSDSDSGVPSSSLITAQSKKKQ